MALKGDRYEGITEITYFMDQVAERGGVVCQKSAGSGAALDQALQQVEYATSASGKSPIGILLNDMVNLDLTKQHPNWYKNQMQKGSKVTILRDGWVVTNMIASGVNPAGTETAYVAADGLLTTSSGVTVQHIGKFESAKDADGFARVYVKLPN